MKLRNVMAVRMLAVLGIAILSAGLAMAQTPQTIVLDGVNDFLPGNLLDADGGDTQFPNIDLGDFYLTNDAVNLYLGMDQDPAGWGVQIGVAIDVNTAAGGDTDPWGRKLEWSLAPKKPDFMFYVNLANNWQAGYQWDGVAWVTLTEGTGALSWQTGTAFKELGIMLGTLGVSASDVINIETWTTQDGATKGPLDAAAGDGVQMSTTTTTIWDTTVPIPMTDMFAYTVQASADANPPLVSSVQATAYPIDSFFDVYFNEPVDQTTAENAANYTFTGATVTSAVRDGGNPSIVHLTLGAAQSASASLYTITVTGVKDLAGNTIVADGVGNVKCFMLKQVVFRGLFGPYLSTLVPGTYQFSVEGGGAPLTWSLCDNAMMTDTGLDDIWEYTTMFLVPGNCGAGTASTSFEWKFVFECGTYEPLAGNRVANLDLATGAIDTLEAYWNDQDPTAFLAHAIDVEFFVDMNNSAIAPGDTVSLNGSVAPLNFNVPSVTEMVDDGTGSDPAAGDGIYATRVRFPAGSLKDVAYKFLLNSNYECSSQGDRSLFLNDAAYDTVGGGLGALTLPVVHYDFCNSIWQAVEVVFSVDMNNPGWDNVRPSDVISVNGTANNAQPPTFDWTVPSLTNMHDDGIAPDLVAGDKIYTVAVVFPDTSQQNIEYKFLYNDIYECSTQSNRTASLDPDTYDAVGNPQILPVDVFQICNLPSDVPGALVKGLQLDQNIPNPFNPTTEISFSVAKAGQGSLRIYDLRGQLVRTLLNGEISAGPGSAIWDGRADTGRSVSSGVYFYRLEVGAQSVAKRMVMLK